MASVPPNPTQLTPPRVAFIDDRSGAISREWYRFFLSLLTATQTNQQEASLAPDTNSLLASYDAVFSTAIQGLEEAPDCCSATASLASEVYSLTDAVFVTPPDLGGTVTTVSVVPANGFAGTVANATTTPAITLTTTITGVLKGDGTAISAATKDVDYLAPSTPVTKTADFTIGVGENWFINNKSGSTCTVTLPAASSYAGRAITFQNYQDQLLVSASSNVVPRAGGAAGTAILDAVAGNWATLVSNGTNWVIMQAAPFNCMLI